MKFSDVFVSLLYGVVILFVLYLLLVLIRRFSEPATNVVVVDQEPDYYWDGWWPWGGSYNWWPAWFPWGGWGGGYYGGYYGGRRR